jgi:hypothetical protein
MRGTQRSTLQRPKAAPVSPNPWPAEAASPSSAQHGGLNFALPPGGTYDPETDTWGSARRRRTPAVLASVGPTESRNQYYEQAVKHMQTGRRFTFYHDGQFKDAFITRNGPSSFTLTSANKSGKRATSSSSQQGSFRPRCGRVGCKQLR